MIDIRRPLAILAAILMAAMVHLLMKPVTAGKFGTEVQVYFSMPGLTAGAGLPLSWVPPNAAEPDTVHCQAGRPESAAIISAGKAAHDLGQAWCRMTFTSRPYPPDGFDPIAYLERTTGWKIGSNTEVAWSSRGLPWKIEWTGFVVGALVLMTLGYIAHRTQRPAQVALAPARAFRWPLAAVYLAILAAGFVLQNEIYRGVGDMGPRESTRQFLFLALVLAPFIEELFYRGWMLSLLRGVWGETPALLISSAVFAAVHAWSDTPVLYVFSVGMLLAAVKVKTNSLFACIVLHAALNLAPLVQSYFSLR